jgi:hypothetical protein
MNASPFDPQAFLDAQQTEVNEERALLPTENPADPNGLYLAVIGEIKTSTGIIGKGEKQGQPWVSINVPLRIQVPSEAQAGGIPPELTITDRAFIDLTPSGSIDNGKGKNRAQRSYREATGMNTPGEPFAWRMLTGRTVKVKIVHEPYQDRFLEKAAAILPA